MNALRTIIKLALAFAFMVAFLESVVATAKWWHGEALSAWEVALALALPVLIGIWVRYYSVFGCGGACLAPPRPTRPPRTIASPDADAGVAPQRSGRSRSILKCGS